MTTETVQQRLTFACELDRRRLTELFSDASIFEDLKALGANVLLMLSDFSPERAAVVKKLNAAGIPVTAIPLLPYEEGYFFTIDNAPRVVERYEEWKEWTAAHGLVWEGVGLDIEPEARFYEQIMENPWGLVPMLLLRLRDTERPRRAKAAYSALINRIHTDAYSVENYQFPIIADERRAESRLDAHHPRSSRRWSEHSDLARDRAGHQGCPTFEERRYRLRGRRGRKRGIGTHSLPQAPLVAGHRGGLRLRRDRFLGSECSCL